MAVVNGVEQTTRQIVDWTEYNRVNAGKPRNPDGSVQGGTDLAGGGQTYTTQNSGSNPGDVTGAMSDKMWNAITNSMNGASEGAYNKSVLTGFVMKPVFDKDGNWTYDYETDGAGNRIQTVGSQLTRAQIEDLAAKHALQAHIAAGVVKDPSTGQWVQTPDRMRVDMQKAINAAEIKKIDADIELNKQKLADANTQFNQQLAFDTQKHLDGLGFQRDQMAQQNDQFNINASGFLANGANTLDRDRFVENARQFNEDLDFKKSVELANAVSDPTRLVQGAALANIWGGSRGGTIMGPGGQAAPTFGPNTAGQNANQNAIADQDVAGAFTTGLGGAVEQAQNLVNQASATNPLVAVSPEINETLAGGVAPAFGNREGVEGSIQPLNTITPTSGDFSKIIPAAFAALSPSGQLQYKALAQARQPGLKPEDLVANIQKQMPKSGAGFVPAAFQIR